MPEKNKKHGRKTRAGKLLTRFLETIAEEVTEIIIDPVTGEDKMVTKAEALARKIWKRALGYKETDIKTGVESVHAPEQSKIGLIFDRIEGRAPTAGEDVKDKVPLSKRVSETGKKNIAAAGEIGDVSCD